MISFIQNHVWDENVQFIQLKYDYHIVSTNESDFAVLG